MTGARALEGGEAGNDFGSTSEERARVGSEDSVDAGPPLAAEGG